MKPLEHYFHFLLFQRTRRTKQQVQKKSHNRQRGCQNNPKELKEKRPASQQHIARGKENQERRDGATGKEKDLQNTQCGIGRISEEKNDLLEESHDAGEKESKMRIPSPLLHNVDHGTKQGEDSEQLTEPKFIGIQL